MHAPSAAHASVSAMAGSSMPPPPPPRSINAKTRAAAAVCRSALCFRNSSASWDVRSGGWLVALLIPLVILSPLSPALVSNALVSHTRKGREEGGRRHLRRVHGGTQRLHRGA